MRRPLNPYVDRQLAAILDPNSCVRPSAVVAARAVAISRLDALRDGQGYLSRPDEGEDTKSGALVRSGEKS